MGLNEELEEHAKEARDPFDRRIAMTMAVIAAVLALVSVAGHLATTEELLNQQKASDTWAFYQAKSIRRHASDVARDLLASIDNDRARRMAEKYTGDADRYTKEGEELQEKARELEKESALQGRRARRYHTGEVFLEMAIVFSSLAILTRRRMFWSAGIAMSGVGALIGATALLLQ